MSGVSSASLARLVGIALAVLGGALTLANRELPLVRNSLVYARASEHVIEHGFDPRPVVADSRLSYDKPILYPWFSSPLVRAFGNHDGLRLGSWLTTAAYLAALLHFARSFRAVLPPGGALGVLWLGALGPCVAYQFWSAHPDGWFAALAVLAWSLTQRLRAGELAPVRGALALGATLLTAILLKNYGLVLLGSCPLYLLWHLRELRADRDRFRRLGPAAAAVFALAGAFALLAWTGHNPLSRLEGEGGGVGQYGTGELWLGARGTWVALALALLLQFQVALACLFRREAWSRELLAPMVCFGLPYVAGLMPFPTTFYNMRYFVPLFALVALPLARGAAALARPLGRGLWIAHATLGLALIAVFNVAPVYRRAAPHLPELEVNWIGVPLSLLDNLRMPLHLEQAAVLAHLDAEVPAGATLYFLDVSYYRDAQHGVYERAGLIRPDITTRYAASRDFQPGDATFYAWSASPVLALEHLGRVTDLGRSLVRVERDG
jgi:hypothetical protein